MHWRVQMEAAAAAALAAQQKAEARVAATLAANEAGLAQRRAAFDEKQSAVEIRNLCARVPSTARTWLMCPCHAYNPLPAQPRHDLLCHCM